MSDDPSSSAPKDYAKQSKQVWMIGGSLMVGALLTSVLCGTSFTLWKGTHAHIIIALIIAAVQVCLQVFIMMHLKNERGIIFKFLVFTMFFVMALFVLTHLHESDPLHDRKDFPSEAK